MQSHKRKCAADGLEKTCIHVHAGVVLLLLLCFTLDVAGFPIFTSSVSRTPKPVPYRGAIFTEKRPTFPLATPSFEPPTAASVNNRERSVTSHITTLNAEGIKLLAGKMWDLNKCPPGILIRVGNKVLTKKSFYCTKNDAMKLAPMLNGEGLKERAYVWCRTAFLFNSLSPQAKSFMVDDLDHFEQDIILRRENVDVVLSSYFPSDVLREASLGAAHDYQAQLTHRRQKRKMTKLGYQWPNGQIPFSMNDPAFSAREKQVILDAISEWERQTCIRFIDTPRQPHTPHVTFMKGTSGCSSTVGKLRYGQLIYLGEGCSYLGTVCHEIGHTLGFYHEQTRPDRDYYVKVEDQNIEIRYRGQFHRSQWNGVFTRGIPYDYSSVMHYGPMAFSKNRKPTLRTTDPEMQMVIGQRQEISFYDLKLANTNYCERSCGTLTLESDSCKNEGYLNPNDCNVCLCPSGLAPPYCEHPLPGKNVNCGRQTLVASERRKTLMSPGYEGGGFPPNAACSYIIKTSAPGRQIKLQFQRHFSFTDDVETCYDYVEIRYKKITMAGPRYCGKKMPTKEFTSHGAELMILINTDDTRAWQGFQLNYREEKCGGCASDSTNEETPCTRVVRFNCAPSGFHGYCFKDEKYCCSGFGLAGGKCRRGVLSVSAATTTTPRPTRRQTTRLALRRSTSRPIFRPFYPFQTISTTKPPIFKVAQHVEKWEPWGEWTDCTATCGLCGRRERTRRCIIPSLCTVNVQKEIQRCGSSVCPFETVTRSKTCRRLRSPTCAWFQFSCYVSYTCYELTTKPRCCVGTPSSGRCLR